MKAPRSPLAAWHPIILGLWWIAICAVTAGSLLPASSLHRLRFDDLHLNDKIVHFANYLVLGSLPVMGTKPASLGMLFSATMIPLGAVLELIQNLVPGRTAELGDLVANTLGVLTGILLVLAAKNVEARLRR